MENLKLEVKQIEKNIFNMVKLTGWDLYFGNTVENFFDVSFKDNKIELYNNVYINNYDELEVNCSTDILIYSKYFNNYFLTEEDYNQFIKQRDIDFINFAKYENIEYRLFFNHGELNEEFIVSSNSYDYIKHIEEELIKQIDNNLIDWNNNFDLLKELLNDIEDFLYDNGLYTDLMSDYSNLIIENYDNIQQAVLIEEIENHNSYINKLIFFNELTKEVKENNLKNKTNKI